MKPGKPSTFATVKFGDGQKRLFFGDLVKDSGRKDTALIVWISLGGPAVLVTVSGWKCHIPSIKTGLAINLSHTIHVLHIFTVPFLPIHSP